MTTLQTEATEEKKRPPRFLLAMPDDVRAAIERAAFVSGRTVTAEINQRLKATLDADAAGPRVEPLNFQTVTLDAGVPGMPKRIVVMRTAEDQAPAGATEAATPLASLSAIDQAMLEVFRAMPPEKQLALLSLFR